MKKYTIILLTAILMFGCVKPAMDIPCGMSYTDNTSARNVKILFIGNSHTYVNDIPKTIKAMAGSLGDKVVIKVSALSGYDLERHSKLDATISAIYSDKWDYVVMQDNGWRSALDDSMARIEVYPYAEKLNEMIKSNSASTEVILYMTQGYTISDYTRMQKHIKETYKGLSEQIDALVAPAGLVWQIFMEKYPDIELFNSDGIHANPNGSYISACTIYSIIFRKKLNNVFIPNNVLEEDGIRIQNTVTNLLYECNPNWEDL